MLMSVRISKEMKIPKNEKSLKDLEIIFEKVDDVSTIGDISTVWGA